MSEADEQLKGVMDHLQDVIQELFELIQNQPEGLSTYTKKSRGNFRKILYKLMKLYADLSH